MKLITRQEEAIWGVGEWVSRYGVESNPFSSPERAAAARALQALGDNPDPDEVERLTGSTGWTFLKCNDCGTTGLHAVVEMGEEPDYDSNTVRVCGACLLKALRLHEGE